MAIDSDIKVFPRRISALMLIGYLLATIPQVVLDPLLLSHVRYRVPRHYPGAWWIIPIAVILFIGTLVLSKRVSRHRYIFATMPFVVACLVSLPIFRPEVPHGNLVFVCPAWFLLGTLTGWIHDHEITDPGTHDPLPASNAQIDFIKEETAIWKGIALTLVTAYLAIIAGLTLSLHAAAREIVTVPGEQFLLIQYNNFELGLMSLFMFLGPIYESIKKVDASNKRLLRVLPEAT